jgi:hypothetical protein
MKYFKAYRNIPFIDNKGWGFHYQKFNKRYWIELPFIGFTFKIN